MTDRIAAVREDPFETEPDDVDFLGAINLALVGAADLETAVKVITKIVERGPKPNDSATWPTKILIDALHECGGSFTT